MELKYPICVPEVWVNADHKVWSNLEELSKYRGMKHLGSVRSWQEATISLRQIFEEYGEKSIQFMMHI